MDKETTIAVTIIGLVAAGVMAAWFYYRWRSNPARQFRITVDREQHGYFKAHGGGRKGNYVVTSASVAEGHSAADLARLAADTLGPQSRDVKDGVGVIVDNPRQALLAYR